MKNIINIIEIMSDLDELRKKVYLDSPEVFVDLVDKIENNQFDEMVLSSMVPFCEYIIA